MNPELGLDIQSTKHLVKLYFKADGLVKNRVDIIVHLMSMVLAPKVAPGTVMSVLDVRNSKLFSPTVRIPFLDRMIAAELAYVASLWGNE